MFAFAKESPEWNSDERIIRLERRQSSWEIKLWTIRTNYWSGPYFTPAPRPGPRVSKWKEKGLGKRNPGIPQCLARLEDSISSQQQKDGRGDVFFGAARISGRLGFDKAQKHVCGVDVCADRAASPPSSPLGRTASVGQMYVQTQGRRGLPFVGLALTVL